MTINLTNQDNIGNYYFGFRTNNSVFNSDQIGISWPTLVNWINTSFGEICAAGTSSDSFSLILPHPNETLTRPAIARNLFGSGKFRFSTTHLSTTNTNINDTNKPEIMIPLSQSMPVSVDNPSYVYYCVLNNFSLNIFSSQFSGNSLSGASDFRSSGFLKNPLYLGNAFPRNAYCYGLQQGGRRTDLENSNTLKALSLSSSIVNYPVSCQVATPGANATEFYLRDSDPPNKAIGYMSNILKTSLDIQVGRIYRNTGIDPDGSNNPHWICVGKIGTDSILMRVWASGLD